MKEIKGGLDEWKDIPQPWIGRLNIAKTAVLPKLMDRFVVTAIKILLPSFCRNQYADSKTLIEMQGTQHSQKNFEKAEQNWSTQHLSISKMSTGLQAFRTACYWHRSVGSSQEGRTHPLHDGRLILDKSAKLIQWQKEWSFRQLVLGPLHSYV